MDYEGDIRHLAGETLAIQALLVGLTASLSRIDPTMDRYVRDAFDAAARFLEHHALVAGPKIPAEHLTHSLRVVEELRAAALGNPKKPMRDI